MGVTAPASPASPTPVLLILWSLLPQASPLLVLSCAPHEAPGNGPGPTRSAPGISLARRPCCQLAGVSGQMLPRKAGPWPGPELGRTVTGGDPARRRGRNPLSLPRASAQGLGCPSICGAPAAAAPPPGPQHTGPTSLPGGAHSTSSSTKSPAPFPSNEEESLPPGKRTSTRQC